MIPGRLIDAALAASTLLSAINLAIADSPEARIAELERINSGRIGLAAIDMKTGRRIEHRSNERFPMCSTFKLLAVGAVLQRVDQGKEKLDRFVPYTPKDILEYAPVTKEHLKEGGMTLGALCQAAIEQSDNTAANLILQTVGGPNGVTQFARSLGDKTTRLDRMEPELNISMPGDERDTTSPAAMCNDLARLFMTSLLSEKSRELLQTWLLNNETGATLIRAGVPKDWRVGDKTGRSGQGEMNDVAVLYPPSGAQIFVSIYVAAPSISDEKRSEIIANVTREIVIALRSSDQG
jgi:beta-lactamase class A